MSQRLPIFADLALAIGLLAPVAMAQKPPAPPPPPTAPPPTNPGRTTNPTPPSTLNGELGMDRVMYLRGRVATDDGTMVPHDALVERVCNSRVRQQVHASPRGDFTMELGTMTDTFVDATGEGTLQSGRANNTQGMGIPRRDLNNCELRATISGFHSDVVSLVELTPSDSNADVGSIVVHRTSKVKGLTVSASSYQVPKEARKAYEKGLEAAKHDRFGEARQSFEKAVEIYPKYGSAWFQLGAVLQKLEQKEPARAAYTRATTIDSRFMPPYLSLASLAFEGNDWPEVLSLTNHIVELDPLRYADVTGFILDLDPLDYAQAYFYNAAANFELNRIADAEKSGLKAERLDVRPRFPQLHLLLAEIFLRKNDYAAAIAETKIYLEKLPHAKNADQVREQLAKLETLNSGKTDQN